MVRYILDKEKRRRILKSCHLDATSGHMGVKKTLDRVTERFFWPGVSKDVNNLVSALLRPLSCVCYATTCQLLIVLT